MPIADRTGWELILMLERAGWRRGMIMDEAPEPFRIADPDRVWYLKRGNKSVNVGYLLCLNLADELGARGVLEIVHFKADGYYGELQKKLKTKARAKALAIQFEGDLEIEDEQRSLEALVEAEMAAIGDAAGEAEVAEVLELEEMVEQLLPPAVPPSPGLVSSPTPSTPPPPIAPTTPPRVISPPGGASTPRGSAPATPGVPAPASPGGAATPRGSAPATPAVLAPASPGAPPPAVGKGHVRVRRGAMDWGPYQFTETIGRSGQRSWQAMCPYHGSRQRPCRKECPFLRGSW